ALRDRSPAGDHQQERPCGIFPAGRRSGHSRPRQHQPDLRLHGQRTRRRLWRRRMTHTATDPRFVRGVELFNAGRYFEAHEEWEPVWRPAPQPARRFVQSLIHAAVALYQWGRENAPGARTQFARGSAKAADYPSTCLGVDSARLWADLAAVLDSPGGERTV